MRNLNSASFFVKLKPTYCFDDITDREAYMEICSPNCIERNDPRARTVENAGGFYNAEDGSPLTSGGIGRV